MEPAQESVERHEVNKRSLDSLAKVMDLLLGKILAVSVSGVNHFQRQRRALVKVEGEGHHFQHASFGPDSQAGVFQGGAQVFETDSGEEGFGLLSGVLFGG